MKVILLQDVKSLGKKGEIVNVNDDMLETLSFQSSLDWKQQERI